MTSIYDHTDYRNFLTTWIKNHGGQAKGLQGQLARSARISSSMISLILKGEKNLSLEQAADIADYLGLSEPETDYFYLLVEFARAGSSKLRAQLLKRIKNQRQKLSHRITQNTELSDEIKAIYYSSWIYSGVRNLIATPGDHTTQSLAARLNLPANVIGRTLEFLVQHGLCKIKNGQLTYGPQKTHVTADSPFVQKHHQNWRVQGFHAMESRSDSNLFFTSPMSLSKEAAETIHQLLPKVVQEIMSISGPSESEVVYCFNMDWFKY